MTSAPPVMILGCGRSGTSIFGELFDGLDRYIYQSEPPFEAVLASDYRSPQAFKGPRESDLHPARPGLSFPLDRFLEAAPARRRLFAPRRNHEAVGTSSEAARWRKNLTDEEAAAIWDIVGATALMMGYSAPVRNGI